MWAIRSGDMISKNSNKCNEDKAYEWCFTNQYPSLTVSLNLSPLRSGKGGTSTPLKTVGLSSSEASSSVAFAFAAVALTAETNPVAYNAYSKVVGENRMLGAFAVSPEIRRARAIAGGSGSGLQCQRRKGVWQRG